MTDDTKHTHGNNFAGRQKWDIFLEEEWPQHRREAKESMRKIEEMHAGIVAIRNDTKFLPTLNDISQTLKDMRSGLLDVLAGKNVVDVDTVKDLLKAQQTSYVNAISTICKIFGVLFIVLAGLKVFLPNWFGG